MFFLDADEFLHCPLLGGLPTIRAQRAHITAKLRHLAGAGVQELRVDVRPYDASTSFSTSTSTSTSIRNSGSSSSNSNSSSISSITALNIERCFSAAFKKQPSLSSMLSHLSQKEGVTAAAAGMVQENSTSPLRGVNPLPSLQSRAYIRDMHSCFSNRCTSFISSALIRMNSIVRTQC